MTLGFSTNFPDGTPTLFKEKILLPYVPGIRQQSPDLLPKIHTFRLGNRWRAGMKMHMVIGNRTKHRWQFNMGFHDIETCISIQTCIIRTVNIPQQGFSIEVDGIEVDPMLFIVNDGFNGPDRFFQWFSHPFKSTCHEGQIIHFTNFRY